MEAVSERTAANWVAALQGFLGPVRQAAAHCELCHDEIAQEHPHLIEPASRELFCVCRACALLFDAPGARHYRRVSPRAERLADFQLSDAQWDGLLIPINMAFFFHSSPRERVLAMYPGPAGATESTLELAAWGDLVAANPVLASLEEDVEALLVNRVDGAREYYRVSMDRCFELVGRIRRQWHGLSGGPEARETIQAFFAELRRETNGGGAASHA